MTVRMTIPVDRLVVQMCADGLDYDDSIMGYGYGHYSVTLTFERGDDAEADAEAEEDDSASTVHQFRLLKKVVHSVKEFFLMCLE